MANSTPHKQILKNSIRLPETPSATSSSSSSNSITTSSSSSQSISTIDYEISTPTSYTSLKDILPSTAVQSPSPHPISAGVSSGYEISIRNRLVKQAAWAYLQPMSVSPGSVGRSFVHRIWLTVVDSPLGILFGRIFGFLERALGGICWW